jgi:hypothetical protein
MKILGSKLSSSTQSECFRRFVNRYTRNHIPTWISLSNRKYPVQFDSDKDWLEHTFFYVKLNGELNNNYNFCESSPTWPDNPELRSEIIKVDRIILK